MLYAKTNTGRFIELLIGAVFLIVLSPVMIAALLGSTKAIEIGDFAAKLEELICKLLSKVW